MRKALLSSAMLLASSYAHSFTLCADNVTIDKILIPNNKTTEMRILPSSRPVNSDISDYHKMLRNGKNEYYISIWRESSNYERYKQKRDLLLTLAASGKPVTIGSKDNNCKGLSDEFQILAHF